MITTNKHKQNTKDINKSLKTKKKPQKTKTRQTKYINTTNKQKQNTEDKNTTNQERQNKKDENTIYKNKS